MEEKDTNLQNSENLQPEPQINLGQQQTSPPGVSPIFRGAVEFVETLAMAVVYVLFVCSFIIRTSMVSGESMVPTLQDKDMLLVSRAFLNPSYGDIVVITKPNYLHEPIIKRVIATEGQEVSIDFESGLVSVDGIALTEEYVNEPTYLASDIQFPMVVPKGELFVMGDNRNHSLDSRSSDIGTIDERYVLGKAMIRFLPFDSFGGLY